MSEALGDLYDRHVPDRRQSSVNCIHMQDSLKRKHCKLRPCLQRTGISRYVTMMMFTTMGGTFRSKKRTFDFLAARTNWDMSLVGPGSNWGRPPRCGKEAQLYPLSLLKSLAGLIVVWSDSSRESYHQGPHYIIEDLDGIDLPSCERARGSIKQLWFPVVTSGSGDNISKCASNEKYEITGKNFKPVIYFNLATDYRKLIHVKIPSQSSLQASKNFCDMSVPQNTGLMPSLCPPFFCASCI